MLILTKESLTYSYTSLAVMIELNSNIKDKFMTELKKIQK